MVETVGINLTTETNTPQQFMLLEENQFAYVAVQRLTEPDSISGTPLVYLYGPAGVGKSHLVGHFVAEFLTGRSEIGWKSLTASQFAADLAENSQNKTVPDFLNSFRELDFLILEDIQSLEGRRETLQALLTVVNELISHGSGMIITSNTSPNGLKNFSRGLISRFRGGISATIASPDLRSRGLLIDQFAEEQGLSIPKPAVRLLAAEFPVSPRELRAMVLQLHSISEVTQSNVDQNLVEKFLDGEVKPAEPTLKEITFAVCKHFGLSVMKLRSSDRRQEYSNPRHLAMHLARELTSEHLSSIAKYFGRGHHSTVVHALKSMKKTLANSPEWRKHLFQLKQRLTSGNIH